MKQTEWTKPGWILLGWDAGEDMHHFHVLGFATNKHKLTDKYLRKTIRGCDKWIVLRCEIDQAWNVFVSDRTPLQGSEGISEFLSSFGWLTQSSDDYYLKIDFTGKYTSLQHLSQEMQRCEKEYAGAEFDINDWLPPART
jgi:hypothetical protein